MKFHTIEIKILNSYRKKNEEKYIQDLGPEWD